MELDKLLLEKLPETYKWKKRVATIQSQTYWDDFALNDDKACSECVKRGMECQEKEVAKFSVINTVVISYSLEDYLKEYAKHYKIAQGSVCDFLHLDALCKRFVLNEMTCTKEEYVNPFDNYKGHNDGKREKARRQLNSVIDLFIHVKEMDDYISKFTEKIGLFSWRIPASVSNNAEKSMNIFMKPQQIVGDITTLSDINAGFKFVQQIYPCIFTFD